MWHGPVFQKLWNQLLGVRFGIRGNAFLGLASLLAVTLVYAAYAPSLSFGFFWDDYHVLRPLTSDEIRRVFLGNWDTTHIEPVFYRPLATSWYALRFAVFGVNASFQHGLSLIGMAVAAVLVGIFVRRETGSLRMGLIAVSLYAIHPAFAYSQAVWLTNQMHLLSSLTVLAALLVWQRVRTRSILAWVPLVALQLVAFGLKEDGIMLSAVIVSLTILRSWTVGDLRLPSRWVVLFAIALTLGLPILRLYLLGQIGGYGTPPAVVAWWFYRRGLYGVFLLTPGRLSYGDHQWQTLARYWSTITLAIGGLLCLASRQSKVRYLFLSGIVVALLFDLPFALVTNAYRMHLVTLGAVIALTAAVEGILSWISSWIWRTSIAAALLFGAFALLPLSRVIADDFSPCNAGVVGGAPPNWGVPEEIRAWSASSKSACAAGTLTPITDLPTIAWAHDTETIRGEQQRWIDASALMFVEWKAQALMLAMRRPNASAKEPVTVVIRSPGRTVRRVITTSDWWYETLPLPATLLDSLAGMHRVEISVDPTYSLSIEDPGGDRRRRGVQFRILRPVREQ